MRMIQIVAHRLIPPSGTGDILRLRGSLSLRAVHVEAHQRGHQRNQEKKERRNK